MDETKQSRVTQLLSGPPFNLVEPIEPDSDFHVLTEWDSFKQLMLVVELEKQFDIQFTPEEVRQINTLSAILKKIS